jgi:hypothetical protein
MLGGEQLGVGDVGAGIAALDVVEAQFVQRLDDQPLVLEREIDAGGLRAVAQGGVEQVKPLAGHERAPRGSRDGIPWFVRARRSARLAKP